MRIACLQMNISFGQPQANYENAEKMITEACKEQLDCIILPELWTTGYDLTKLQDIADTKAQEAINFLTAAAKKHSIHIIGGSVANTTDDGILNTMIIINRDGELVHKYSKVHLFQLMDEHLYLAGGKEKGIFILDGNTYGGVICYDIRFPEWIRSHVLSGAEAIFVTAEWPLTRLEHWRTLLMARAIENQCYVIACNRAGEDPNNVFAGHSMIIDPWGEIVAEASEKEEILFGEIDLSAVKTARSKIPVFTDRKPEFYTP